VGQGSKPTLDVQHLQKLTEEASLAAAETYAAEFVALLPRIGGLIVRAVVARDGNLVLDASRNLKSKSWLVGALRLNQLCSELELAVALADWATATAVARDIELHLPRLQKALTRAPDLTLTTWSPRKPVTAMAS
jgi:hypothetical protein